MGRRGSAHRVMSLSVYSSESAQVSEGWCSLVARVVEHLVLGFNQPSLLVGMASHWD